MRLLLDASYNEAQNLDLTKPIWFCDVDGVLNAIPFEEIWIGPKESSRSMYDPALFDPANWQVNRLKPNTNSHFALDREAQLELNTNVSRYGEYGLDEPNYRELRIRYSSTLIKKIKQAIENQEVNFVFLTAWRSEALRLLNPLFGFENVPFLHWEQRRSDYSQYGKYWAIIDFMESISTAPAWVWTDDVATRNLVTGRGKNKYAQIECDRRIGTQDRLVLCTNPKWGISRYEWAKISQFLENH